MITTFAPYRGFEIAAKPSGIKTFWRPLWREVGRGTWTEGCVLGDDAVDAAQCARECIDYNYRVEVWEFLNGREYHALTDGFIPPNA